MMLLNVGHALWRGEKKMTVQKRFICESAWVWKALSALCFACSHIIIYKLGRGVHALPALELATYQVGGAALVVTARRFILKWQGKNVTPVASVPLKFKLWACLRSLVFSIAIVCWCTTLTKFPLAWSASFKLLSPISASIMGVVFLKERVTWQRSLAWILGISGAWILCYIHQTGTVDAALWGALFGPVVGILGFSASTLLGKKLLGYASYEKVTLWLLWGAIPVLLGASLKYWKGFASEQFPWVITLGLLSAGGYITLNRALQQADVGYVMPVGFLRFALMSTLGILFLGEPFHTRALWGVILIVMGVGILLWDLPYSRSAKDSKKL